MQSRLDEPRAYSDWRWLGQHIRCALTPDEPRLLTRFLDDGHELVVHHDLPAWRIFEGSFQLLLDSATDRALPWHWRCLCLDHAYLPLQSLRPLARDPLRRRRLLGLQRRLATLRLAPSLSYIEPEEGNTA
ncbi:FagA protein [Pseudomonas tohonis]|uniref:FagA protein n=1 Tax=Pseudomonas tohonis TaxID=2725477 RepID=UPI001F414C3C|nr:FagA protein [Pseudomonas tohonis]